MKSLLIASVIVLFVGPRPAHSREFDAETGTINMGVRNYDPGTGRFLQMEPLFSPFNFRNLNGYGYAYSSPLNYVDPNGASPISAGLLWILNGFANPANAPGLGTPTYSPVVSDQELVNIILLGGPEALLGGAEINLTSKGMSHVMARHAMCGAETAGKSVFFAETDIAALIQRASAASPTIQANGRLAYTMNAGRAIGIARGAGATSQYTVITDAAGNLITAFPGAP
jgi:RHS repeat-associated protein